VGVRSGRNPGASEHTEALNDPRGWVRLARRLLEAAGIDLEGRARLDQPNKERLIKLRGPGELRGQDMGCEIALHEVEMADRVEQARSDRSEDLVEIRFDDLVERSAAGPGGDSSGVIGRVGEHVDAADHEVIGVASEISWSGVKRGICPISRR
jgi:hypothetical protein